MCSVRARVDTGRLCPLPSGSDRLFTTAPLLRPWDVRERERRDKAGRGVRRGVWCDGRRKAPSFSAYVCVRACVSCLCGCCGWWGPLQKKIVKKDRFQTSRVDRLREEPPFGVNSFLSLSRSRSFSCLVWDSFIHRLMIQLSKWIDLEDEGSSTT